VAAGRGRLTASAAVQQGVPRATPRTSTGLRRPQAAGLAALERLVAGNARFVAGAGLRSAPDRRALLDLAEGQQPFATILGCSDSRVPPELLFDQGFGDFFIARVAGNVVSTGVLGSLHAGAHLRTPLFLVLGHEGCGALQAALAMKLRGLKERARIAVLLRTMLPGLKNADRKLRREALLRAAVEANVRWSMRQLAEMPEGRRVLREGSAMLAGAVYELHTGRVRLLDA
jgi:carbonic anhydrase